jgi:hypothetical protein
MKHSPRTCALHLVVVESGLRRFDLGAFVFDAEVETDIIVQNTDESRPQLLRRVAQRIGALERERPRTVKATLVVDTAYESSTHARSLIARRLATHLDRCGGGELLLLAPEVNNDSLRHQLLSIADALLNNAPSSLSFSVQLQESQRRANRRGLVQMGSVVAGQRPSLLRRNTSWRRETKALTALH